jgi:hypothetical protein
LSPEEEARAYQRELNDELGLYSPRLGMPPDRVKRNVMWVWIGAMAFGGSAAVVGDGEAARLGASGFFATVVCLAVAFGYPPLYWRAVEKARAAKREADARRAAPSV